jgi:hypothetical protein
MTVQKVGIDSQEAKDREDLEGYNGCREIANQGRSVWIIVLVVLLVPLMLASAERGEAAEELAKGSPRIQVIPEQYDFGEIPPEVVSHIFLVKNIGESDLEIYHVSTSCGCTTATIDKRMIEPGRIAEIVVRFDPNLHTSSKKGKTLQLKRSVYIRSNDPETPEKSVLITATITEGG